MDQDRLVRLMQGRREAIKTDEEHSAVHVSIFSMLQALDRQEITEGQVLRLLRLQAVRLADDPAQATLYRQAAAAIRPMQRKDH